MYIYLILAAVCIGVVVLVVVAAAQGRRRETVQRVDAIIDYGTRVTTPELTDLSVYLETEPSGGAIAALATWLGGRFAGRLTAFSETEIQQQLMAAGIYSVSARTIMGYRVLSTIALPVLVIVATGVHSALSVLLVVLATFAGWVLPLVVVQRKARQRIQTLDRALPDLIDLLSVMIEAGLSFPQALRIASDRFEAPLGDELRLTLQEQTMGLGMDEALAHLGQRADTTAVRSFVRAMAQGEKMGISTGQIMRNLAQEMRKHRRAVAEERAQKAPVLMLFPLVFMIFPALFIVLMTPAVISLIHNLKNF
jgi:tight adherence protein C